MELNKMDIYCKARDNARVLKLLDTLKEENKNNRLKEAEDTCLVGLVWLNKSRIADFAKLGYKAYGKFLFGKFVVELKKDDTNG